MSEDWLFSLTVIAMVVVFVIFMVYSLFFSQDEAVEGVSITNIIAENWPPFLAALINVIIVVIYFVLLKILKG